MKKISTLLALCLFVFGSWAQETRYQLLPSSQPESNSYFGKSVALWGDYLMVGAPEEDDVATNEGAVYFFKRGSDGLWSESQRLLTASHWANNRLGWAIDISENYAIASAPVNIGSSFTTGRFPYALIYALDVDGTWVKADSISASDIVEYDDFGEAVVINEEWAFVGNDEGQKVYAYKKQVNGLWDETQIISKPISTSGFGSRLGLSSNYLTISGDVDQEVFTYTYNDVSGDWELVDQLDLGYTMWDMAVLDSIMVVSNISDTDKGSGAGAASIYFLGTDGEWSFSEKLLSPTGAANDRFGYSVAIDTNFIVVTTRETSTAQSYERGLDDKFTHKKTLQGSANDQTVAVFDEDVAVGDYRATANSISSSGAVLMYFAGDDDKLPPNVTDFTFFGSPTASSTSIIYDLTFDEDVSGVSVDDFSVKVEIGEVNATVLGVVALSPSLYRLSVSVSGRGYFSLVLNNIDGSIIDASGNSLTIGPNYSNVFRTATTSLPTTIYSLSTGQTISHPLDSDQAADFFGYSIDMQNGKAVVGTYGYNSAQGTVFLLEESEGTWSQTQQYTSFLTTTVAAQVGHSVAINGDYIFAGAPNDTYSSKSNHGGIINWKNGIESSPIRGDNGSANNYRGKFMSSRESLMIFGSVDELVEGANTGAAYVYEIQGDGSLGFVTTLTPSYLDADMDYGQSITNNEDFIVIGAPSSDEKGSLVGAVYIYSKNVEGDWVEHQVLYPDRDIAFNQFGFDVSMDGKTLAVGATAQKLNYYNTSPGAVYIYRLNQEGFWEKETMLFHDSGANSDKLGYRVRLSGDFLVAQAFDDDDGGLASGQVFLFYRNADGNWYQIDDLPNVSASDRIGTGLAIEGNKILVGIPYRDTEGSNGGEVRAYSINTTANVWDGIAWSDGSPSVSDVVIFAADYTFAEGEVLEVGDAYFSGNVDFTIEYNASLVLNGNVYNSANITVLSGSSFITSSTTIFEGEDITFLRQTTFSDGKYSVVGSPVESASRADLGSIAYAYDVSQSDTTGNSILRFVKMDDNTETLIPGKGYFSAFTDELAFKGIPNTGTINMALETGFSTGVAYNLVSNPYPAAIDFSEFYAANFDLIGGGAIYIWVDGGSDASRRTNSDYITVSHLDPTNAVGGATSDKTWTGYIPSMQGFFVRALDTDNLIFSDDMKVTSNNADNGYFRQVSNAPIPKIRLAMEGEGRSFTTLIAFPEDATLGLDDAYDAFRLSTGVGLYSLVGDQALAVQAMPFTHYEIPLGITMDQDGVYQLSIIETSDLPENVELSIVDYATGQYHPISDRAYVFDQIAVKQSRRFGLAIQSSAITALQNIGLQPKIYGFDGEINVISSDGGLLKVYGLDGKLRVNTTLLAGHSKLNIKDEGIYIAVLETPTTVHRVKIILRH